MITLVSFTEIATFLGLEKDEEDYPDLTLIQESVVAAFEDHTNRLFQEKEYVQSIYLGCELTRMVPLLAIPIQSISSLLIDAQEITNYEVTAYGIRLGNKYKNVKIEVAYEGGIAEVSNALKRAALLQTVYEYQNKHSVGIEVVSTEGGSIVKPELGLLKEVKKLLSAFIHPYPTF